MKRIFLIALLLATPIAARAQGLQQSIDTASSQVVRIVTDMGNKIAEQANQATTLHQQIAAKDAQIEALTKERDALKVPPADPAK
jgi:flagellar hook-associated protein FlgK